MSTISALSSLLGTSSSTEITTTTTDNSTLTTEDFYTILVAQLQCQDPLSPMDSAEISSQMTQISTLEFQNNTNELLEELTEKIESQTDDSLINYIGKEVILSGSACSVTDGEVSGADFSIDEAAEVTITIYDQDGELVKQLDSESLAAGVHELNWDGTDYDGETVEDGIYTYDISAVNYNGDTIDVTTNFTGIVTGVSYDYETPYLMIGDNLVDPDSVLVVEEVSS